jgi:hypothetical protein
MAGRTGRRPRSWPLLVLTVAALACAGPGCRTVSRDQIEECHRLSQTLRTENAQLKDQVLALRSQNQDLSERSVDDVRRLSQLEEANRQLERSVLAYQDERSRIEAAYKELRASLPGSLQPLSLSEGPGAALAAAEGKAEDPAEEAPAAPGRKSRPPEAKPGGWAPARPDPAARPIPEPGDP